MKNYVLDASVAAKWFLPPAHEPLAREALALLAHYKNGETHFLVPDMFFVEFANVFRKAERYGWCDPATADAAITQIRNSCFPTFSSSALIEPALGIARAFSRPVYDALYIALAIEVGTQMITADTKLANAVTPHLPVIWLGSL